MRAVRVAAIRLRLLDLAVGDGYRGARRREGRLDVAGDVQLLGSVRVDGGMARRGRAGHRRNVEQEAAAELLAERDADIAADIAGIDVETVPEMFEAVREDDA